VAYSKIHPDQSGGKERGGKEQRGGLALIQLAAADAVLPKNMPKSNRPAWGVVVGERQSYFTVGSLLLPLRNLH